jgi:hypothetical protein
MKLFEMIMFLLLNERGEGSTGLLGGDEGGDPTPPSEGDEGGEGGSPDWHQLYDKDIIDKMDWANDVDPDVLKEPSLKPFVDKEGKINLGNVLKSYVHTKKQVGKQGVQIPDENATEDQINDFWSKLGYAPEADAYKGQIKRQEESAISEEEYKVILDGLHAQKIPVKQAQGIVAQMEEARKIQDEAMVNAKVGQIEEGVESLRKDWGGAFEQNVNVASRTLKHFTEDNPEVFKAIADNPEIANNPALLKVFHAIGSKVFSEADFKGPNFSQGAMTPEQANEEINSIKGDMSHPYWNSRHPAHKDAQKKMRKLYEYKNA